MILQSKQRFGVAATLAGLVAFSVMRTGASSTKIALMTMCAYGLLVFVIRFTHLSIKDLGLSPEAIRTSVKISLTLIGAVGLLGIIAYTFSPATFKDPRYNQSFTNALVSIFFILPLKTVLLEEFVFRGVLFALGAKLYSDRAAIIISSLAFGLWHILPSQGFGARPLPLTDLLIPESIMIIGIVIATSLFGVLLCLLRQRYKSLLPAIALHWSINAAGILLAYFAWS